MKKAAKKSDTVEMRSEYDFSNAVRGKYAGRFANGYSVRIVQKDGSAVIEKHAKDGKVTRKIVPAPATREVRLKVPVKTFAKLKKLAASRGTTEKGIIQELIAQGINGRNAG
jgi:hypothetical protein